MLRSLPPSIREGFGILKNMNIKSLLTRLSTKELLSLKKDVDLLVMERTLPNAIKIEDLNISRRCLNVFKMAGFIYLSQISEISIRDAVSLRNCGRSSITEMTDHLHSHGLDWTDINTNYKHV